MKVTNKELTIIKDTLKKSGIEDAEVKTNKEGYEIFIKTQKKNSLVVFTIANVFKSMTNINVNVNFVEILDEKRMTIEQVQERWKQFASVNYQEVDAKILYQEYNEKFECAQSFEIPAYQSFDRRPHIIG